MARMNSQQFRRASEAAADMTVQDAEKFRRELIYMFASSKPRVFIRQPDQRGFFIGTVCLQK